MGAVFKIGERSEEILDLTAPATEQGGIVARWVRDALDRDTSADAPAAESPAV